MVDITHPFGHLPSLRVMMVKLEDYDSHHHRHAHNHHGAGKILGCIKKKSN